MGAITFRDVSQDDYDWLLELRKLTMNPHLIASGIEPLESGHEEAVQTDYEWTQVIRLDHSDIGIIKLIRARSPWHLRHIQIHPDYQGKGVGTDVMNRVLSDAEQASASIVLNVLHVNPAKTLYERLGFKIVESGEKSQKMEWRA